MKNSTQYFIEKTKSKSGKANLYNIVRLDASGKKIIIKTARGLKLAKRFIERHNKGAKQ